MLGLGLEEKLLAKIVNNTREPDMVSRWRCPRVFFHIGMKFTSDREDSFVEMSTFKCLVILWPCVRGAKVGNK